MSSGIIASLLPVIDSILGVRDQVGAALKTVSIVTRTWSGAAPGEAGTTAVDTSIPVMPSPGIKQYSNDLRLLEGGAVKQGDILLVGISKNVFPTLASIDGSATTENIEMFYDLSGELFRAISVKENYLTWDVLVRRLSAQDRY